MPGFLEVRMEGKQEHFSGKVTAESDPDKLGPKIARHLGAASIDDVVLRSTEPADKNAVVDLAEEVATVQKKLAADPIGLISHTLVLLATLGACLRPAAAALPAAAPDGPAAPAQRAAVPDAAAAPPSSKGDADAGTAGKAGGKDSKRKSDGSAAASKDPADTWTKTFLEYLPDFIPRGLDSKFLTDTSSKRQPVTTVVDGEEVTEMVDRHEDWLYNKRALHTWVTAQDPTTPHLHHRKFGICVSNRLEAQNRAGNSRKSPQSEAMQQSWDARVPHAPWTQMLSTFAAPRIRGSASGFKPPAPGMSGKHTPGSGPPRRNSGAPDTKSAAKGAAAPGGRQVDAAAVENKLKLPSKKPGAKRGKPAKPRAVRENDVDETGGSDSDGGGSSNMSVHEVSEPDAISEPSPKRKVLAAVLENQQDTLPEDATAYMKDRVVTIARNKVRQEEIGVEKRASDELADPAAAKKAADKEKRAQNAKATGPRSPSKRRTRKKNAPEAATAADEADAETA